MFHTKGVLPTKLGITNKVIRNPPALLPPQRAWAIHVANYLGKSPCPQHTFSFLDPIWLILYSQSDNGHWVVVTFNGGIPLDTNTAGRLKQKNWSDQFIEFKSLLPDNKETTVSIKIDKKKYILFKYRFCKKSKFDLYWSVVNSLLSFYGYLY